MSKETDQEKKPSIIERVKQYFVDTRGELRKVTWPTRPQLINLTLIVLAVTVAMAIFLGAMDLLFSTLIGWIIG